MYKRKKVTDNDVINFAIARVLSAIQSMGAQQFEIGDATIIGCAFPIAALYPQKYTPVEQDGKKYLSYSDEWLCVFASENYATLIKECTPTLKPNGWGSHTNIIYGEHTYAMPTSRDMNRIFALIRY
jgi:hypothetical protein